MKISFNKDLSRSEIISMIGEEWVLKAEAEQCEVEGVPVSWETTEYTATFCSPLRSERDKFITILVYYCYYNQSHEFDYEPTRFQLREDRF